MAIRDLEAFVRQRATDFDSNLDVTPGSPFDSKVIQPLVRRTGIDPFTVDLLTFATARLKQLFPRLATDEGDNITDLLIKPVTLLWDPIVRENTRVRRGLSFIDPTTLTLEEADALGGNFFIPRRLGSLARGPARIYFSTPQNATVTQNNFVNSRGGLVFFPTEVQSIRSQEMLLNIDVDGLYYFDINVVAAEPGAGYNIGPNELTSIANLPAAVRVSNSRRYRFGEDEESAVDYTGRLQSSLGEKSMNTLRGIAAKVLDSFPEVQRLNVVGFGDPEMQRDLIQGGGLGAPLAAGMQGSILFDTEGKAYSRRFFTSEVDFQSLVGLSETGLVLTIINPGGVNDAFSTVDTIKDVDVRAVVDANILDIEEQILIQGAVGLPWTLRRKELTLSHIPGGILFPDGANGTVTIPDNEVHIGGSHDIHIRTTDFDDATLTLQNISDDEPGLLGLLGVVTQTTPGVFRLNDIQLGVTYAEYDATYNLLEDAGSRGYSIEIQDGPNAGTYSIVTINQRIGGSSPLVTVAENFTLVEGTARRWRIFDDINIDLVEPKETRLSDTDLVTTQGSDIVSTLASTDFDAYGVAKGDTLRILEGIEAGDYELVEDPISPGFDTLRIDRPFPRTLGATKYVIFRPNAQVIERPLVRIRSIELLDSSSQPQGSFIPYAKPVDVQSRAFQNPARGVKHDFKDARVGLISKEATGGTFPGISSGQTLTITVLQAPGAPPSSYTFAFSVANPSLATVIAEINAAFLVLIGEAEAAYLATPSRVGIRPVGGTGVVAITGGTARTGLYGDSQFRTTADIRVESVEILGGWTTLSPEIDETTGLDVVHIVDGVNAGFYPGPFLLDPDATSTFVSTTPSKALVLADSLDDLLAGINTDFLAPESSRRIKVGARSLGSARVFFLEPTTFEVNSRETAFEFDTGDTGIARFYPDPTLSHQRIPPLPDGAIPTDGASTAGLVDFYSTSQEFILSGIKPGDKLVVETWPVTGTKVLPSPVPGLVGQTFIFSLDGGPDRTLIFIRDDISLALTEVSQAGVANQINAKAGVTICDVDGSGRLRFSTELPLVIRRTGTALPTILEDILGYSPAKAFTDEDVSNASPHVGEYEIEQVVSATWLKIVWNPLGYGFPPVTGYSSSVTEQTFRVLKEGVQRIATTQMADNTAEAGLYYFDVELVSEGTGDFWNIAADEQMTISGYKSDGYYLTTDDSNLTFSDLEQVKLVLSASILEQGVDDNPQNATKLKGQNLLIKYDRAATITNVQNFAQSDFERAVSSSPLVRHLIPHFVRFDATYYGGSEESVVIPDVEKLIRDLFPIDTLDSSAIQKIITDRGASKITNPLTLLALVHYVDRTIYAQRSQDSLSTGRLAAFIPDLLNIVRKVS